MSTSFVIPDFTGCGWNMCKQRLKVWNWSFIPWPWPKQDYRCLKKNAENTKEEATGGAFL